MSTTEIQTVLRDMTWIKISDISTALHAVSDQFEIFCRHNEWGGGGGEWVIRLIIISSQNRAFDDASFQNNVIQIA